MGVKSFDQWYADRHGQSLSQRLASRVQPFYRTWEEFAVAISDYATYTARSLELQGAPPPAPKAVKFPPPLGIGILRPETSEQIINADTPAGMRRAIFEAATHSSLIRNALYAADLRGMSAEDRYTFLAYYALRQLQDTSDELLKVLRTMPAPWKDVP